MSGIWQDILGSIGRTFKVGLFNGTTIDASGNTADHTLATPDKGGTIATTDDVATKQDALVSGTNIKTINGESILGSGDLAVSGGGGGGSAGSSPNSITVKTTDFTFSDQSTLYQFNAALVGLLPASPADGETYFAIGNN